MTYHHYQKVYLIMIINYRGFPVLEANIKSLLNRGMDKAEQVILTGCSGNEKHQYYYIIPVSSYLQLGVLVLTFTLTMWKQCCLHQQLIMQCLMLGKLNVLYYYYMHAWYNTIIVVSFAGTSLMYLMPRGNMHFEMQLKRVRLLPHSHSWHYCDYMVCIIATELHKPGLNQRCVADNPNDKWKCVLPQVFRSILSIYQ